MDVTELKKQFLIVRGATPVPEGWQRRDLDAGWVLHHQRDLRIGTRKGRDGRDVLVLGDAFCLEDPEDGGAGRYATLAWPHLETDRAGAVLSLFYGGEGEGLAVSSNAGLVAAALAGGAASPDLTHELRRGSPFCYVPAPGTRYRGVRRLFRDQRIDLARSRVERHAKPVTPLPSHGIAVETAAEALIAAVRAIREDTAGRLFLQLTAGLDSRTLAAVMLAAGIEFETVTLDFPGKPRTDTTIAARISRAHGLNHSAEGLQAPDPAARAAYLRQISHGVTDWGTETFSSNSDGYLGAGDVVLGGACFELGRQYFARRIGADLDLDTATGAALWDRLAGAPPAPEFTGFLDDWLAWRRGAPYGLDLATTLYLDQRIAAWAATNMAGGDLVAGRMLHPANHPKVYAALITPGPADQEAGRLQHDIIARLAPKLADFPLNPVGLDERVARIVWRTKRTARRAIRRLLPGAA